MLRALARLLGTLVLLGCFTVASRVTATVTAPRVYMALGDSVAVGVGASSPAKTYASMVFQSLQASPISGVETGVQFAKSNETSSSFIDGGQLAQALAYINQLDSDVTVVTLTIGGNDLLNLLKPGQPCENPQSTACPPAITNALSTFNTNYTTIMQQLTQALTNDPGAEQLLVMTYYNPFSGVGGPRTTYDQLTDTALLGSDGTVDCTLLNPADARVGLNDVITCIGRFYDTTIVDVYPLFKNGGLALTHMADQAAGVHPNDTGHAVIAGAFLRALTHQMFLPRIMRAA